MEAIKPEKRFKMATALENHPVDPGQASS